MRIHQLWNSPSILLGYLLLNFDIKMKDIYFLNKVDIEVTNSLVEVNDYGRDFAQVCLERSPSQ